MLKKLTQYFFITLACVFLGFVIFFIILFIAPGARIFGLKYIAVDTHKYEKTQSLSSKYSFDEIEIKAENIPIYIVYTQYHDFAYTYYDNYNGLTKSEMQDPVCKDSCVNKKVTIDVSTYEKFVFESSNSERYLQLRIPVEGIAGTNAYKKSLTIKSNNSDVYFSMSDRTTTLVPSWNSVSIDTDGKIICDTKTYAYDFCLKTNKSVVVDETQNYIFATNYDIELSFGSVTILSDVTGDLKVKTDTGDIKFKNCGNLNVRTNFGNIYSSSNQLITVGGIVDIESKTGCVTLGDVNGYGNNKIVTSSGEVSINKINNGSIETKTGFVDINTVDNMKIKTQVGKIDVLNVVTNLEVSSIWSSIDVGSDDSSVNSVNLSTVLGDINVKSVLNIVELKTETGDINLDAKNMTKAKINCAGNLTATSLKGEVEINCAGNVYLDFADLNNKVKLNLEDSASRVDVYLTENPNNQYSQIGFDLKGKSVKLFMKNKNGSTYSTLPTVANKDLLYSRFLEIDGKNANISVYFPYGN